MAQNRVLAEPVLRIQPNPTAEVYVFFKTPLCEKSVYFRDEYGKMKGKDMPLVALAYEESDAVFACFFTYIHSSRMASGKNRGVLTELSGLELWECDRLGARVGCPGFRDTVLRAWCAKFLIYDNLDSDEIMTVFTREDTDPIVLDFLAQIYVRWDSKLPTLDNGRSYPVRFLEMATRILLERVHSNEKAKFTVLNYIKTREQDPFSKAAENVGFVPLKGENGRLVLRISESPPSFPPRKKTRVSK